MEKETHLGLIQLTISEQGLILHMDGIIYYMKVQIETKQINIGSTTTTNNGSEQSNPSPIDKFLHRYLQQSLFVLYYLKLVITVEEIEKQQRRKGNCYTHMNYHICKNIHKSKHQIIVNPGNRQQLIGYILTKTNEKEITCIQCKYK